MGYAGEHLHGITENAIRESVLNGQFGSSDRIADAIRTAATMILEKFTAPKNDRSLIDNSTSIITPDKSAVSESAPTGFHLQTVRPSKSP